MKYFVTMVLVLAAVPSTCVESEVHSVTSKQYSLDGDFNTIQATAHIQFEINHVSGEASVIIETEQWVHSNGYISVSTKPSFS